MQKLVKSIVEDRAVLQSLIHLQRDQVKVFDFPIPDKFWFSRNRILWSRFVGFLEDPQQNAYQLQQALLQSRQFRNRYGIKRMVVNPNQTVSITFHKL